MTSAFIPLPTLPAGSVPPTPTDADITDVHFRVPKGFVKGANYRQVHPLATKYQAAYAVPRNERSGMDVLSVVLYRLRPVRPVGTVAEQRAQVKSFNRTAHAKPLSPLTEAEVGGRLGYEQSLFEKPDYRYVTWFVIATGHVLQVSCEVGTQVHKLATACGQWVKSIRVN